MSKGGDDPGLPPGFEFLGGTIRTMIRDSLGAGPNPAGLPGNVQDDKSLGSALRGRRGALDQFADLFGLGGEGGGGYDITQAFRSGMEGLGQIASGDFSATTEGLSDLFAPVSQRNLDLGSAQIREQAALGGNFASTGTMREIGDLAEGIAATEQSQIGSILPSVLGQQVSAGTAGLGSLGTILSPFEQTVGAERTVPLSNLAAAANFIGGSPIVPGTPKDNSALGSVLSSIISSSATYAGMTSGAAACWVSAVCFRDDPDMFLLARHYVLTELPQPFNTLYRIYSKSIARWLHSYPRALRAVRWGLTKWTNWRHSRRGS